MPRTRPAKPQTPLAIAHLCAAAALDKKARQPLLLDVAQLTGYTDFFLLLSATSTRQVQAVAEHVQAVLKKAGIKPLGASGIPEGQWALLDFGDVVVHIFHEPVREYYDLESLWGDAPQMRLDADALAALTAAPAGKRISRAKENKHHATASQA